MKVWAWRLVGFLALSASLVFVLGMLALIASGTAPSSLSASGASDGVASPAERLPMEPSISDVQAVRDELVEDLRRGERARVGVMTLTGAESEIDDFREVIGREPDIVQVAIGWERDAFDPTLIPRLVRRGVIPMISWEPWDFRQSVDPELQPKFSLRRIINGEFDSYIDEWAEGIAASDLPVMIRFAHEANGVWYPWAAGVNGNEAGEYAEAWRHVHDRFAAANAVNVIWVWSPNVNFDGGSPIAPLYPGDDLVDVVGLVGYFGHFATTPLRPFTFDELFGSSLAEIRTVTELPVLITETSGTEDGGFKDEWIADFLAEVAARREIIGFIWFEAIKEDDWTVASSPEAQASFVNGIADPAFSD